MHTLKFSIDIKAPAAQIHAWMISEEGFAEWASTFSPDTYFKGNWETGGKVIYYSPRQDGTEATMICTITENIPGRVLHIQPIGLVHEGKEVTSGKMVSGMNQSYEFYTFAEDQGTTILNIEVSVYDDLVNFFQEKWPQALGKIKVMNEAKALI